MNMRQMYNVRLAETHQIAPSSYASSWSRARHSAAIRQDERDTAQIEHLMQLGCSLGLPVFCGCQEMTSYYPPDVFWCLCARASTDAELHRLRYQGSCRVMLALWRGHMCASLGPSWLPCGVFRGRVSYCPTGSMKVCRSVDHCRAALSRRRSATGKQEVFMVLRQ